MLTMSATNHKFLLIDDDPRHANALNVALVATNDGSSKFQWVRTLSNGLDLRNHKGVWAVFLNLSLPDSRGLETFDRLRSISSTAPIVVLGDSDEEGICKTAMRHGAEDYLLEGHIDSFAFARAIRAIEKREVAQVRHPRQRTKFVA
jgi:DNA-binding NarL/FixJ family response regulator